MNILKDIPAPPERRRRDSGTPRREPVTGVTAALDGMRVGECLVVDAPTAARWGYQRAYDAGLRWPDRRYTASRVGGVWRIWRVH